MDSVGFGSKAELPPVVVSLSWDGPCHVSDQLLEFFRSDPTGTESRETISP